MSRATPHQRRRALADRAERRRHRAVATAQHRGRALATREAVEDSIFALHTPRRDPQASRASRCRSVPRPRRPVFRLRLVVDEFVLSQRREHNGWCAQPLRVHHVSNCRTEARECSGSQVQRRPRVRQFCCIVTTRYVVQGSNLKAVIVLKAFDVTVRIAVADVQPLQS